MELAREMSAVCILPGHVYFKKNPKIKLTKCPNRTMKNEIDFILTNKISAIKDVTNHNRFRT